MNKVDKKVKDYLERAEELISRDKYSIGGLDAFKRDVVEIAKMIQREETK